MPIVWQGPELWEMGNQLVEVSRLHDKLHDKFV